MIIRDTKRYASLLLVPPVAFLLLRAHRGIGMIVCKLAPQAKIKEKYIVKLSDSVFYFIQYLLLYLISTATLTETGYYGDHLVLFRELPNPLTPKVKFTYTLELAVYVAGLLNLISRKEDTIRKNYSDFTKLIVHHFLTISLILASFMTGYTTIGVLVMNIHDMCDIFIEGSKSAKYIVGVRATTVFMFSLIMIVFLYNRGYIFSRYVLWAIPKDYPYVAAPELNVKSYERTDFNNVFSYVWHVFANIRNFPTVMWVCELLLLGLEVLNICWIVNLFQILIHYAKTGKAGDIRDPDERQEMEVNKRV